MKLKSKDGALLLLMAFLRNLYNFLNDCFLFLDEIWISKLETVDCKNNENVILIFTVGSAQEDKIGAAFATCSTEYHWTEKCFKLAPYCTIYQTETLAIKMALEMVKKELQRQKWSKVKIFSDS